MDIGKEQDEPVDVPMIQPEEIPVEEPAGVPVQEPVIIGQ